MWTSVKTRAHTHCKLMNTYHVHTADVSPALNGSSALEQFELVNVIKMCNGIMFHFYPGLPHMIVKTQAMTGPGV